MRQPQRGKEKPNVYPGGKAPAGPHRRGGAAQCGGRALFRLLADYAVRRGAAAIVRGVRNTSDFDVEYQLALINQDIHPGLETMLLPASAAYQHFSSSMAREMIRYGQPLEKYLPASIIPLVRELTEKKEG